MRFHILSVDWNGEALSDEQMWVVRQVAAKHLRGRKKNAIFNFKHTLCEGQITRQKEGRYGTFSGTFFHADLGTVNGVPWNVDFLLPYGSEHAVVDDETIVITTRSLSTNPFEYKVVNHHVADISKPTTVH